MADHPFFFILYLFFFFFLRLLTPFSFPSALILIIFPFMLIYNTRKRQNTRPKEPSCNYMKNESSIFTLKCLSFLLFQTTSLSLLFFFFLFQFQSSHAYLSSFFFFLVLVSKFSRLWVYMTATCSIYCCHDTHFWKVKLPICFSHSPLTPACVHAM